MEQKIIKFFTIFNFLFIMYFPRECSKQIFFEHIEKQICFNLHSGFFIANLI